MHKRTTGGMSLWQFQQLADAEDIVHFVSGRDGGCSNGDRSSLNLSYGIGDAPENVHQNLHKLAKAIGTSEGTLIFPQQTHSNNVMVVDKATKVESLVASDALITAVPGVCIAVLAADCVPVLVYDPNRKVIAAVHSGWRGTVAKILSNTIGLMQDQFFSEVEQLKICIGPSIGPSVYEVGEEVIEAVHAAFPADVDKLLRPVIQGKALFNLWEANKRQAVALGVSEDNIEIAAICTYTHHDHFFSARRAFHEGRFAAGIMLVK